MMNGFELLENGKYRLWVNGESVLICDSISIAISKKTGIAMKWGCTKSVNDWHINYLKSLRNVKLPDTGEIMGIPVSTLKDAHEEMKNELEIINFRYANDHDIEEINKVINNTGYGLKYLSNRKGMLMWYPEPEYPDDVSITHSSDVLEEISNRTSDIDIITVNVHDDHLQDFMYTSKDQPTPPVQNTEILLRKLHNDISDSVDWNSVPHAVDGLDIILDIDEWLKANLSTSDDMESQQVAQTEVYQSIIELHGNPDAAQSWVAADIPNFEALLAGIISYGRSTNMNPEVAAYTLTRVLLNMIGETNIISNRGEDDK